MSTLRISLFGYVEIAHDSWPSEVTLPRMAQALLAYLLLKRDCYHPREVLAELFWGDRRQDRARSCLSTALWRLRRILEPDSTPRGTYLLTTSSGEVGFNWESDHWLDVAVFEEVVRQMLKKPPPAMMAAEVRQLEYALQLHAGDLLNGFYDDWALRERERLRQLYLDGLTHLMRYYKHHGMCKQGLACGQKILDYDPLRESIYRDMMYLYRQNGQPTRAVRVYQKCCQLLADELHVAPMAETQAMYVQIVTATVQPGQPAEFYENLVTLQQALQQLYLASQEFTQAQSKLQQAIQLVEHFYQHHQQWLANLE